MSFTFLSPVKAFEATLSWSNVGTAGFSDGQTTYTSIAIDRSGTPYVVYQDNGHNNKATVMKCALVNVNIESIDDIDVANGTDKDDIKKYKIVFIEDMVEF